VLYAVAASFLVAFSFLGAAAFLGAAFLVAAGFAAALVTRPDLVLLRTAGFSSAATA